MSTSPFDVVVSSGSLRPGPDEGVEFPHQWTADEVVVQSAFTGAHLLHLSIAGCVLNDVHREAETLGLALDGVRVTAGGDFDRQSWHSNGVEYSIEVDSEHSDSDIVRLIGVVDEVAEIPKAVRAEASVTRT